MSRSSAVVDVNPDEVALQLESLLRDKVAWFARGCSPDRVEHHLGEISKLISAAKDEGVKELRDVSLNIPEQEQEEFVLCLQRLRTLKMEKRVLSLLYGKLKRIGVPERFYRIPPPRPPGMSAADDEEDGWGGDV